MATTTGTALEAFKEALLSPEVIRATYKTSTMTEAMQLAVRLAEAKVADLDAA